MGAKVGDSGPGDAVSRLDEALPSIGMLEAEHENERRRTENLLAAFERPAGGAKRRAPSRGPGFVEYYATKAEVAIGRGTEDKPARRAADDATVVRQPQRRRRGVPAWLFWGVASAAMVGIGATAGILTTGNPPRAASPTTASAIRPARAPAALARDEVPLPDTAPPSAQTAAEATSAAPARPSSRARTYGSAPPRHRVDDATPPPRPEDDGPVRQL